MVYLPQISHIDRVLLVCRVIYCVYHHNCKIRHLHQDLPRNMNNLFHAICYVYVYFTIFTFGYVKFLRY